MLHSLTLVMVLMTLKLSLWSLLLSALPTPCILAHHASAFNNKIQFCSCRFVQIQIWPCYVKHLLFLSYSSLGLEHIFHFPLLSSFPSYKIRYHHHPPPRNTSLNLQVGFNSPHLCFHTAWFSYNIALITLIIITYYLSSLPLDCCSLSLVSNYVLSTWTFPSLSTVPRTWQMKCLTVHPMGV